MCFKWFSFQHLPPRPVPDDLGQIIPRPVLINVSRRKYENLTKTLKLKAKNTKTFIFKFKKITSGQLNKYMGSLQSADRDLWSYKIFIGTFIQAFSINY